MNAIVSLDPAIRNSRSNAVSGYEDYLTNSVDFDLLISEIESSGGSCANVIRKLTELENGSENLLEKFLNKLHDGMNKHDQEIERMCNHHYQGFVDSIQELMRVRKDAEALRGKLTTISNSVSDSVDQLRASCQELAHSQDTLENCDKAIDALQVCLPILEQYSHIQKSITAKRYYPALKSLEYLEHSQIPLIASYSFADSLSKQIPHMRKAIKTASLSELTDFLENIRKSSVYLGAIAMKLSADKTGMDPGFMGGFNKSNTKNYGKGRPAPKPPQQFSKKHVNPFTGVQDAPDAFKVELEELVSVPSEDEDEEGCGTNFEDRVDLGAVYRCLHIHSVLGERAEFEKYYRIQRKKQCQLSLSLSPSQQESLRNYSEFFSNIVGFFVVEDTIRHTVPSMVTKMYLDDLWSSTALRLIGVIKANAEKITDSDVLLRLKDFCVLFGRTMQSLGFNIASLKELSEQVWRCYQNVLATEWKDRFEELFQRDDYTAIKLINKDDYHMILDMYPCATPEFDVQAFPKTLSFSMMVPRIFQAVKEYIDVCCRFMENLDLSQTELEDMVNKATNTLFSNCLTRCMTTAIRGSRGNLLRLIQLSINMDELESACAKLEAHILVIVTGAPPPDAADDGVSSAAGSGNRQGQMLVPRSRLHGISYFKDIRAEAESQIYATINYKVDEFISLASYEWDVENTHLSGNYSQLKPTEYIVDLMNYLVGTFHGFTNLPPKVAQTACMSSCKHISQSLDRMLQSPEVRAISDQALNQVSVDLSECEKFASSEPVPGINGETLLLTFQDLRQLLDLIISEDWSSFFNPDIKAKKYDRVNLGNLIRILDKLREFDKKKSSFFQSMMQKKERDKRKRHDDILRQLRDLQASSYMK